MRRSARESVDRVYEGIEILRRKEAEQSVVLDDLNATQAALQLMATVAVAEALIEAGEALREGLGR